MIEVIHYQYQATEQPLERNLSEYYDQVRKVLPDLPDKLQIYFSDYGIVPESGVGGYAYSPGIITISIDPDFKDKKKQLQDLRPTIFHESFHQFQDFTGASEPYPAIENCIYEGMATVFEREYTNVFEPYGDYRQTSKANLKKWINALKEISAQDFGDEKVYSAWKFYHPQLRERWITYRVGTWITDQVLTRHRLKILDLSTKTAAEVLVMYDQ